MKRKCKCECERKTVEICKCDAPVGFRSETKFCREFKHSTPVSTESFAIQFDGRLLLSISGYLSYGRYECNLEEAAAIRDALTALLEKCGQ